MGRPPNLNLNLKFKQMDRSPNLNLNLKFKQLDRSPLQRRKNGGGSSVGQNRQLGQVAGGF